MNKTIGWMKRVGLVAALTLGAVAVAGPSEAATATGNFQVTTNVFGACTLGVADLVFPDYTTGQAANVDGATAVTVNCPGASAGSPIAAQFKLATASGNYVMASGANSLNYGLFQDAGRATPFQNNVNVNVSVTTTSQPVSVYGRIPGNQSPPTGAYAQTVTATLTY